MAFRSSVESSGTWGSTATVTKPVGTVDGDILILYLSGDSGAQTHVGISGFTQIGSTQNVTNGDTNTFSFWYRVASSEPSSYTADWGSTAGFGDKAYILESYSGRNTTTPIDNSGAAWAIVNANSGSPPSSPVTITATGVTTVTNGCDIVWIGGMDKNTASVGSYTPPSGTTIRSNPDAALFCDGVSADYNQSTAGATGNLVGTWTLSSASGNYVFLVVALAPAGGGSSPAIKRLKLNPGFLLKGSDKLLAA